MQPSLRFAVQNYFEGGYHPMGHIGVNSDLEKFEIESDKFYDIQNDRTLKYKLN